MNARGAMGIVLAAIARDAGLIGDQMFVALVVMALGTSLLSGPAMKWLLYRAEPEEDVVTLLRRGAFVSELHARDAGRRHPRARPRPRLAPRRDEARRARRRARARARSRRRASATRWPSRTPPSRGSTRPLLALGRSPRGIDFDAPDGRPARIVFLLLIPPKAYEEEVRILASIARATFDARAREELLAASGLEEVDAGAQPQRQAHPRVHAPEAGIPPRGRRTGKKDTNERVEVSDDDSDGRTPTRPSDRVNRSR